MGNSARNYWRWAASRLEGGQIAEALALVERGLELDADCADGYLVSARIMEQGGRDGGAIGFYERVVALKPERSDYNGWCWRLPIASSGTRITRNAVTDGCWRWSRIIRRRPRCGGR